MPIRHLVLLKFKPEVSAQQQAELERSFCALQGAIADVIGLEWGRNNSPEGLDKGFSHCFNLTFADDAGRARYLPHPVHQAFVAQLKPALDDVLVFDYTV